VTVRHKANLMPDGFDMIGSIFTLKNLQPMILIVHGDHRTLGYDWLTAANNVCRYQSNVSVW